MAGKFDVRGCVYTYTILRVARAVIYISICLDIFKSSFEVGGTSTSQLISMSIALLNGLSKVSRVRALTRKWNWINTGRAVCVTRTKFRVASRRSSRCYSRETKVIDANSDDKVSPIPKLTARLTRRRLVHPGNARRSFGFYAASFGWEQKEATTPGVNDTRLSVTHGSLLVEWAARGRALNFIINNNYYRRVGTDSLETPKFACALIPFRLRARQSYRPPLTDGGVRWAQKCSVRMSRETGLIAF